MRLDLWAFDTLQPFGLPPRVGGYLLVLGYLALLLVIHRDGLAETRRFDQKKLLGLLVALGIAALSSAVFLIYLPGPEMVPLPNLPDTMELPGTPILGAVAIVLIGGWLGVWPAALLGAVSGLVRALWLTGRGLQMIELALVAAGVAFLLRQNFGGPLFGRLRRPAVAGLLGGVGASVVAFPSLYASTSPGTAFLPAVDFAWSVVRATILPNVIEWTLAGLVAEFVFRRLPSLNMPIGPVAPPPYALSLTRRFLFVFIPVFSLTFVALVVAVTGIAIRSAVDLTLEQMAHDAEAASAAIPDLNVISSNLLNQFAQRATLAEGTPEEQRAIMAELMDLEDQLRTTAYFRQLVLFDHQGQVINAYPDLDDASAVPLVEEERTFTHRAATMGHPGMTRVWVAGYGVPMLTHVVPLTGRDGELLGALAGRVDLRTALAPTVDSLQGTVGAGRGFVVDEHWSIIAHINQDRLMQPWSPNVESVRDLNERLTPGGEGDAYEGIGPNGTRQLVYYLRGLGHPWTLAIIVPYERVLSMATKVAGPLMLFLGGAGVVLAVAISLLTRRINQPLVALSKAAGAMAHRRLDAPITVSGQDEVGQLGEALEHMRQALQARLAELQLLLGVSRKVAASLSLVHGVPTILDGALEATGADGARVVVHMGVGGERVRAITFARGELGAPMAALDANVIDLVRREPLLHLENTTRARSILDTSGVEDQVGALLALPLRTPQGFQGTLWLAFRRPHAFSQAEVSFMTTLASQTAVLVENVQLFETAERGRRRLAAILSSTDDPVIVTDQSNALLLLNPAAEAILGMVATDAIGRPAADVISNKGVLALLTDDLETSVNREVEIGDKIYYAKVSSFSSEDDPVTGRVAVLRDITHLRELSDLKTEFVNTVSHDLRGPLTFMRGYVTMLPMIGDMTTKQKDYMERIIVGIDQMTLLVEDLLSLARIESDIGLLIKPLDIAEMVKAAAYTHRPKAVGKGLSYKVEIAEGLPETMGDPTLLRQAVSNLIDNAIKYTTRGEVLIKARATTKHVVILVKDTGPGISQADQVRLFEKFYRVRRRDSLDIKGTGLGLAIVKSIVERRHGGRVWVESQLGAGSTFYIVLPIQHE